MRLTFSISNKAKKTVDLIDKSFFFNLDEKSISRADLMRFAIALGYVQGYTSNLEGRVSFVRTEYIREDIRVFASLYYDHEIAKGDKGIETITDENAILDIAEGYAETGFNVLASILQDNHDSENYSLKLIHEMDKMIKDYFPEE